MSGDPNQPTRDVQRIADEIARYMEQNASGADTLEGVTRWWIARQRLSEAEDKVRKAIQNLCDRGLMRQRTLPDGTVLYSPVRPSRGES